MKFLRNPEIKRNLLFCLILTAIFIGVGFIYDFLFGILLFFACLAFTAMHFTYTYRRYQNISGLSLDIDTILHGENIIYMDKYKEGELSILTDEISKMTLRLREQSSLLQQDKIYLADSIADISHQIRTPLTSMNILLSLLAEPELSNQRRGELHQEINRLCARIEWLIEALLKISRLDAGTVVFQNKAVAVEALIKKASNPLTIPMELRQQQLGIFLETGSEAFRGDFSWSAEALGNILKNCMEHNKTGGKIIICARENPIFTEISVTDNGSGFDQADLPHLFERFYKGKNAGDQSIGIGLALSRMIITKQNGTLKADNHPSGGARFVIRFYKMLLPS